MSVTPALPVEGLKPVRLARGWSQIDLAVAAGVSPTTVLNLERGVNTPLPSTARKLARALELPIAEPFPELFE